MSDKSVDIKIVSKSCPAETQPITLGLEVGVRDIEQFRASRLATGIGAATANKDLTVLKRLFNLAILHAI